MSNEKKKIVTKTNAPTMRASRKEKIKTLRARTAKEASEIEDKKQDYAHAYIIWKSTDVFMEIECACGTTSYVDSHFAYQVKCPSCGTVYHCNPNVELIALDNEPSDYILDANIDDEFRAEREKANMQVIVDALWREGIRPSKNVKTRKRL